LVTHLQKGSAALSYAEKSFKNIGLKGRKIISLPGAQTCFGPVLLLMQPKAM
jgi:hypothetical protein